MGTITKPIEYVIDENDSKEKRVYVEWQGFFITTSWHSSSEEMVKEIRGMIDDYWYQHEDVTEILEFCMEWVAPIILD